ncbi:hypothetical protein [Roseobacter litoralis]|uniref:Uncharacterized protein n=1 Tax=Roseobacter litoralis (strain ATCC 49566 / DSM 6996 / JCM 21268 / NBRC 15278 / OCh 149) TaxID=391595 RepID=F7ZJN9_ROSLO|nr:hypothetical protein [Roseobacter litoralis]AEI93870.1 hypothetical protein RLO149_c018820 [Roseobacter litoralis Och 149]
MSNSGKNETGRLFDDLQREIAGLDVGRQTRFFVDGGSDPDGSKREKSDRAVTRALTALERLLSQDAEYAQLYHEVRDDVARIEMVVTNELMAAQGKAMAEAATVFDMRNRAGTLPDGTVVFRSAETGEVFTEDGKALAAGDEEDVTWKKDSPSWEDYSAAVDRTDAAQQRVRDLQTYQAEVLQPARDKLEDQDNPPTEQELEDIKRDIFERAPDGLNVSAEPPVAELADSSPIPTSTVAKPSV